MSLDDPRTLVFACVGLALLAPLVFLVDCAVQRYHERAGR